MANIANPYALEELFELTTSEMVAYDHKTGMPLYSATLKSSEIAKAVTTTDIKAGINNNTIMSIQGDVDLSVTISDVKIDRQLEAMKLGSTLEKRSVLLSAFPKNYTLVTGSGSAKITLEKTPAAGENVVIYNLKTGAPVDSEDYEVSGTEVTFTTLQVGDTVKVGSYLYEESSADVVDFATSGAGANLRLELRTPLFNSAQEVVMWRQTVIYKASLGTDFTSSNTSEVGESPIETTFKALKDDKISENSLGFIAYIPVE